MILLTDGEILKIAHDTYTRDIVSTGKDIAKAQLKKVVEWGLKVCVATSHEGYVNSLNQGLCRDCWQALLEEVK